MYSSVDTGYAPSADSLKTLLRMTSSSILLYFALVKEANNHLTFLIII